MSWGHLGSHALCWLAIACFLFWGQVPLRVRRLLALLASATGMVFLVLGLNTQGQRDAPTAGAFLLGSSYVTGQVSAAASLPYYVMTAVCLLSGTLGLALPEATVDRLAPHRILTAVTVSMVVTLVRLGLEQAAAPVSWTRVAGITNLAPLVGAYLALSRIPAESRVRTFGLALLAYAFSIRAWVAVLYVTATHLRLGSHYDLSAVARVSLPFLGERQFEPASWDQLLNLAILPQLTFWPLFTVLAGTVGGGLTLLTSWSVARLGRRARMRAATVS